MVNYVCENCEYTTSHKGDFIKHQNKIKPCVNKNKTIVVSPAINIDNSNNTISKNADELSSIKSEIMLMRIEIERLKERNIYLENKMMDFVYTRQHDMSNNELKYFVRDEINVLKMDMLSFKLEVLKTPYTQQPVQPVQEPVQEPVQPVQQPQIIQIVQPVAEQAKPKEIIKKDKPLFYRDLYKDCLVLNDYINNMEYHPNDLYSIYNATGNDTIQQFYSGFTKLFIRKINEIKTETNRPIFCTDKSLNTIHFKYIDKEPKYKMVAYDWDELYKKYKDKITNGDIDVKKLEQNEWGEYIIKEVDDNVKPDIEWIKESQDYPLFMKVLLNFHKNIFKFLSGGEGKFENSEYAHYLCNKTDEMTNELTDLNTAKNIWINTVRIMSAVSIKDDIKKLVALICKAIYVE